VHGLPARWPSDAAGIEVLGVDLDLRERSNVQAETVARETARQLCSAYPRANVLLKIDSTLRGPVAGLVTGALVGSARQVAVIAPAFPEQGRLLREGRVVVDGQVGASLTEALGMDHTALLAANFAGSAEEVELAVEHARMRGASRVVVDADGIESLRSVAEAWRRHAAEWLLVGSAGIARQVAANALPSTRGTGSDRTTPHLESLRHSHRRAAVGNAPPASGPVVVVAGSPAAATQLQIEHLRGLGPIVLVGPQMPRPPIPPRPNRVVVLCTAQTAERDSGENARAVAETIAAWAAEFTPQAVVLAGGATARLVCERLGADGVRLSGELQPGIPFGSLQGGRWDGVLMVTKAGGFGSPETLLDVVHALGVSSVAERTHD
jgi:D-threonate/D-erythronate kinase